MFKIQTWYRDLFWEWCQKHDIVCEYMGTDRHGIGLDFKQYDTWYIGNERDRTLAMLRWA